MCLINESLDLVIVYTKGLAADEGNGTQREISSGNKTRRNTETRKQTESDKLKVIQNKQ